MAENQNTPASGASESSGGASALTKTMDNIVALCRRRGFIFQSSEIYGGINGFWDYGPLGVELKRNLKDAWWHDIVRAPGKGPDGSLIEMVGLDSTIITHPKVWEASGHVANFADPMSRCARCGNAVRADHLWEVITTQSAWFDSLLQEVEPSTGKIDTERLLRWARGKGKRLAPNLALVRNPEVTLSWLTERINSQPANRLELKELTQYLATEQLAQTGLQTPCPVCGGEMSESRPFKLMFESHAGLTQTEDSKVYLRPETAQGIFCNFRNVVDTSRVKVPFGIAQVGKAFRNEVTPRHYTFRSREFEQMEIEFFIRPDSAKEWYAYWRDTRFNWWKSVGLSGDNLQLREHDRDELAHYARDGAGTSDIEYRFPFTAPGFGELEGVAHRTDFDLRQHAQHSGLGDKLKYFDQELQVKLQAEGRPREEITEKSKYFPHVIEPSAGADRGTLALLCEAFTSDPSRPSGVYMKFRPRMAPIKAGIFPLVNKDGMPEVAEKLYLELREKYTVQFDEKQTIGKRYARMDEAGTPYCFTIDGETLSGGGSTVTVRHRDTQQQERIALDKVGAFLAEAING
ncbi:MAG: glycine--tRNA ligase [Phycisphaeraceae bacterium]|nr:glycine--tRNA ligase [Phycisphaeraceae bacterium]